ncbi:SDR family oxidoreductase [Methylobacterium sp. WL30]|uniref:SDR family oxidoreductase n=1 Tax=unclassified Methylobacterium TaxID=2615210 RepID=UPI0011CC574D|nr:MULTISPECIES: SDR family oxidoreductase [unclassified Methylobacterium]TXN40171.1 SDR family oxidoreductase [Methylobacterium sp. WL93]TXN48996.1 SDR family oxidoreductase [Methylobacterium sp. WL119]TXN66395.1 SDR family oxidoreductase [Methylobacterium sp. WL30]
MATKRSAIVTGSSQGIGAAVAERLARDGLAVTINYSGNEAAARALADRITASGGQAIAVKADVSDPAAVAALFDETERAFGGVDVLVNNAGIMRLKPIAEADDDLFDRHVAVNLKGVFNGLREGARRIREGGRIVSFSSSVVGLYQPGYGVYAATKAGVEAMTHVLAKELGPKRITVNAIAPGPVATELFLGGKTDEQVAQVTRMIPLGRLGEPGDIAGAIAFLVGPDGGWVNGQILRANGGAV